MKCLLCQYSTNEKSQLKKHYVKYHNIDKDNVFFKKLIDQKHVLPKKCKKCNEFVINKTDHDFLMHYDKDFSIDDIDDLDKPLTVTVIGDIEKFEITFKEHSSDYNFFNSESVVDQFLAQVQAVIPRYDDDVLIRAGFSIENRQQTLDNYSDPLTQTRYWSTEPIQTKSFNEFVIFKTRESILKRVINNRLSGSAWNFHKFNYLNVKVLKISDRMTR